MATFGKRIKLARLAFGLTQGGIARLSDSHTQNVSKWEQRVFEPSLPTKKLLSQNLHLSLDWLNSGEGIPFLDDSVAVMRPQPKNFLLAIDLITAAAADAASVDVFFAKDRKGNIEYALKFRLSGNNACFVILCPPLGFERSFHKFLMGTLFKQHGAVATLDKPASETDTYGLESVFATFDSAKTRKHEYFFMQLYNAHNKKQLIDFIYSRDVSLVKKLDAMILKVAPEWVNAYRHHHQAFRDIVMKWVKGSAFTDKQWSIIEEYVSKEAISAILPQHNKDYVQMLLINIMKGNNLEPFTIAYAELLSLILRESRGESIARPLLDEKKDLLYWPQQ